MSNGGFSRKSIAFYGNCDIIKMSQMGHLEGFMQRDRLFLLEGLSQEEKQRCWSIDKGEEAAPSKGAIIYDSQHAKRALALVLEGVVCVLHGRVVMNELHAGDVFGAAALFGKEDPYPTTVVAHTDCRVLFIPQATISAWMAAVPQVGENYIRLLSDRIRFLNRRLSTLTAGHTDGKLWRYLIAHRNENGIVQLSGGIGELAKALNMGRSSLYRGLDALTADGRIIRRGKEIQIILKEE
jgi:CRP-like cAMP-binding protein